MVSRKEFLKLQKEWYQKIKVDGFTDIEYIRNGEPAEWLKGNSKFSEEEVALAMSPELEQQAQINYDTTYDYYYLATALLSDPDNFESKEDMDIWKRHAEGQSLRTIGGTVNFSHSKVMRIIDKYKSQHLNIDKKGKLKR